MRLSFVPALVPILLSLACSGGEEPSGSPGSGAGGPVGSDGGSPGTGGGTDFGTGGGGNAPSSGGGTTGTGGTGGDDGNVGGPGSYALPPPSKCSNQFAVDECRQGDPNSACGGVCPNDHGPTAKNACESGKPGVPVQYACPRHMLFSSEMVQAVIDDGYEGAFNYGIVGHDPDPQNLDAGLSDSCCQCYQLVFDTPTYLTDASLTPPPPLVVQSANTQASGPTGFDLFMGAGGFGVFNACDGSIPQCNHFGHSQYTGYPSVGQAFNGGVKPGPDSVNCTNGNNALTDAVIAEPSCQSKIEAACNEITASSAMLQEESRKSCVQSNQAGSYYHENWNVYVRRVTCPKHLMEVTGCKIAPDPSLPQPDPTIQTAAQAEAAGFSRGLNDQRYHTTTMQDCCMPTCAWANNVSASTVDGYDSFYACRDDGTPVTE